MSYKFSEADLTKEKSIFEIYRLSRKIRPGKLQTFIVIAVAAALTFNALFLEVDISSLIRDVRLWSSMGLNFSITTLGFLIAGFTIFATLSKPEMMLAMMDVINEKTGLPYLKYNFFAFMKVFIFYIFYSAVYLLVVLFGQPDGFMANIIKISPYSACLKYAVACVSYVVIGSSFIYLLLLLKTFIFNIYATVMNALRWEYRKSREN